MKKRISSLLMAIVMAAVLLAGCGQDASKETKEAGAEEAVAEDPIHDVKEWVQYQVFLPLGNFFST